MTPLVDARCLELAGRLSATDLTLAAGEIVAVVGPNGSGKTSLLHALAGIGRPRGELRVDGRDVRSLPRALWPSHIGYMPASRDIAWPLRGRDLVALGLPPDGDGGRLDAVLDLLDLHHVGSKRADRLSTGERARLLLARALLPEPRLLLLDEPTANLDPLWQFRVMDLLGSIVGRSRCAMVIAMHDLDLAARYAQRLLLIDAGRIVADGRPDAVLAGPEMARVFGIERKPDGWQPIRPRADPRSSP